MPNHYELLNIERDATQDQIRKAYLEAAKLHHPDKGGDPTVFHQIKNAYDTLSNEYKRAAYNRELSQQSIRSEQTTPKTQQTPPPSKQTSAPSDSDNLRMYGGNIIENGKPKNYYEFFGFKTGGNFNNDALASRKNELLAKHKSSTQDQACIQKAFDSLANENSRKDYDNKLRNNYLEHIKKLDADKRLNMEWVEKQDLHGLYHLQNLMSFFQRNTIQAAPSYGDVKGLSQQPSPTLARPQFIRSSQDLEEKKDAKSLSPSLKPQPQLIINPEENQIIIYTQTPSSAAPGGAYKLSQGHTLKSVAEDGLAYMAAKDLEIGKDFRMDPYRNKETGKEAVVICAMTSKGKMALEEFLEEQTKKGVLLKSQVECPEWLTAQMKETDQEIETQEKRSTAPTPFKTQPHA